MKTTLKLLSEIVDNTQWMIGDMDDLLKMIWEYNNFLKQPLLLEMFIPCKDGVPLEELKKPLSQRGETSRYEMRYNIEYQQAKDRILFKGFETYIGKRERDSYLTNGIMRIVFCTDGFVRVNSQYKLIQDLCNKVDLVDKEYKRLNLG